MPAPKDPEKCKLWKKHLSKSHSGEKHNMFGTHRSQKTKDKISKTQKGKFVSQKTRDKMRQAKLGTHRSEETKEKLRKAFSGEKNPQWKEKIQKICPVCKVVFKVKPSEKNQQSCSRECNGKLHSGENSPMFGKPNPAFSERLRQRTGEKHPLWQGGISFEPYDTKFNRQLKATIRHRDGYKCQKCGCPEIENKENLTSHHIDYDKKNCKPFNLISLCKGCNSEVNFNRPYWTKYFGKTIKKAMTSSSLQLHFNYAIKKKEKSLKFS